ncbi:MAG TPA: ATP-dependent DNA helicase RecQ, partial [Anaerolineales bacterium]|nr:ATP-dependent DNA helicase RecQ [Anaerolineales bacterium]
MSTPASILKETFGYDTFRPLQQEVIENVLSRRDTLAVMPTGGGKSLCYQIPSLLFEGLTVVVSPLISLMKDQVEQLRAFGVPSLFLNSSLSPQEYQENMDYVRRGEVKLLYVAPETLLAPRILSLLDSIQVDCLTIDEAHCISEWGHDFRPEYRQLVEVRKRYPNAVCLALTATATSRVRQDIRSTLKFTTTNEFVASFNRDNLYIEVARKRDAYAQTLELLERYKDQSGIVYCFSRRQVDELSAYLLSRGYSVRPYHAGLEDAERKRNQEAFIRDDAQIIVATIAFGMGINKPNVRFVIHFDLPKSIESYYQEIGRAGRDGLPAHCTLLYSYGDVG